MRNHELVKLSEKQPPYPPDLVPFDVFLFPKSVLKKCCFDTMGDLKTSLSKALQDISKEAFCDAQTPVGKMCE